MIDPSTPPGESGHRDSPVVRSHNEWDPLEEVIVGLPDGAAVPELQPGVVETMPAEHRAYFRAHGGRPFAPEVLDAARREIDGFAALLEREGVRVRFPEELDHTRPFATPDWSSAAGLYAAMPRDGMLVVGDEIIEVPMAWRCRYFETAAFRPLLREYFAAGARWTAAPKPLLRDEQFVPDADASGALASAEVEPTFDAADFVRCGRDLFGQRSHVTNALGFAWLRRHLGPEYRVHEVDVVDEHPMHIDATMLPLAAGRLLVNRERLPRIPEIFRDWEILDAPPPARRDEGAFLMCSAWVSVNVLSLDEERVVVEASEEPLAAALESWGFTPVPCAFRAFNAIGGSFHCATLDVRRRGELASYF